MYKIWQREKSAIIVAVLTVLITGLVFQSWLFTTALTLTAYIIWLYFRLTKLEIWLSRGTKASEVYDDSGFIGDIIRHLYHQKKVHNDRKKRTKDILRRLNRNISALPDATVLLNDQLEIEWSNEPARYLLGINPRYDLGQRISNLFRHPKFLRYLISPDKRDKLELESPIDPSSTLQIKIVRFGRNQRLLSARNISDQKQLQEGLKNFVANASHELKTPLTTISGHLEMMEDEKNLSKQGKKSLKAAQKQSSRMQRLINDLLLLSQVESYQLQPNEGTKVSLTEIMGNVLSVIDRSCQEESMSCSYPDNIALLCIKVEVESICINLIDNAIKYSADDAPIEVKWSLTGQGECKFSVTDQGPGISQQEIPHITDRYYRGSHTTDTTAGSGLGLAIVKHAAAKHGASLTISSQLNKGSSFTVIFPTYRVIDDKSTTDNVIDLAGFK